MVIVLQRSPCKDGGMRNKMVSDLALMAELSDLALLAVDNLGLSKYYPYFC
jgi:hypothetical protein